MQSNALRLYPARLTKNETRLAGGGFSELWVEGRPSADQWRTLLDFSLAHRDVRMASLGERAYAFCAASDSAEMRELADRLAIEVASSPRDFAETDDTEPVAHLPLRLPKRVFVDLAAHLGRRLTVPEADGLRTAWASSFAGTTLPEAIDATLTTAMHTPTGEVLQLAIRALAVDHYASDSRPTLAPCFEWEALDLDNRTTTKIGKEAK